MNFGKNYIYKYLIFFCRWLLNRFTIHSFDKLDCREGIGSNLGWDGSIAAYQ
jgi:hypothetical protein